LARHWWLTPIILVTQEAEIRRIEVRSQPEQFVREILSQTKKDWWTGSRYSPNSNPSTTKIN
jgi:hypothetical protein